MQQTTEYEKKKLFLLHPTKNKKVNVGYIQNKKKSVLSSKDLLIAQVITVMHTTKMSNYISNIIIVTTPMYL